MSEHRLQNAIRNALVDDGMFYRANVGQAWAGDRDRIAEMRFPPGTVVLRNARPFSTGLPPGFSDVFGLTTIVITPDMVGQRFAPFCAIETKTDKGRASERQTAFIEAVNAAGGRAGIARSVEHAREIVQGRRRASK